MISQNEYSFILLGTKQNKAKQNKTKQKKEGRNEKSHKTRTGPLYRPVSFILLKK